MTQTATQPALGANVTEFTVSDLAGAIKRALEEGFGYVRLRGEISGFRGQHASGHCYFGLKDDKAKIDAVVWKTTWARLKVKPEEGMEVVVQGRVTTYPGSSKYQIVIESLEPAGVGALMALIEERKRKFAAEGLFEEARKKARPYLPRLVGIITSPTGAVIRDMLHGFQRALPDARHRVARARAGRDLRGRGRRRDCRLQRIPPRRSLRAPRHPHRRARRRQPRGPVGLQRGDRRARGRRKPHPGHLRRGHETDWTLIDLVADARAPTPTKAAEWAVPKYAELAESTEKFGLRLTSAARRSLQSARTHLKAAARGLPRLEDIIALPRQRFDAREKRLARALLANTRAHHTRYVRTASRLRPGPIRQRIAVCGERATALQARAGQALLNRLAARRRQLESSGKLLASLSYQGVLQRGFVLVRDSDGRMVREAANLHAGDALELEFRDGRVDAETRSVRTAGVKDSGGPTSRRRARSAGATHAASARQRPRLTVLRRALLKLLLKDNRATLP